MAGACVGSRPWKPDSAGEARFDTGTCREVGDHDREFTTRSQRESGAPPAGHTDSRGRRGRRGAVAGEGLDSDRDHGEDCCRKQNRRDAGHKHGEPEYTEHQGLRVVGCEESRDDPSVPQREVENYGYYQQSDD